VKKTVKGRKRELKQRPAVSEDPVYEALLEIVPGICDTEAGKQLFNIMSRFTGYHAPIIAKDGNGRIDPEAAIYNDAMRNVYRYFRGFMPVEKIAEIEHGVYPYDIETEKQKNVEKETD
jgi:hypothetical protein